MSEATAPGGWHEALAAAHAAINELAALVEKQDAELKALRNAQARSCAASEWVAAATVGDAW